MDLQQGFQWYMVKRFRLNKDQEWLMILLMHCEFTGYYGSLTSLTRRIATWNIPLTGYYKRLPLGAVLTNCIADHGKDGKKCQKWLFNCLTTESQSAWLSTYLVIITQPVRRGAGEVTAPPSENEREAQPLAPPLTEVYVCFKALWSATSARAI